MANNRRINTLNSDGSRCGQDVGHGVAADAFEESHRSRSRESQPFLSLTRRQDSPTWEILRRTRVYSGHFHPFLKILFDIFFFSLLNEPVCVFIINTQLLMPCIYEHLLGKQDRFESETFKYYKGFLWHLIKVYNKLSDPSLNVFLLFKTANFKKGDCIVSHAIILDVLHRSRVCKGTTKWMHYCLKQL